MKTTAAARHPQIARPQPSLTAAVERLLDNESLRSGLTDDEYGPLLNDAVRQLERAAAQFGPGSRFEREARFITERLEARVQQLEHSTRIPDNGSAVYRALRAAALDGHLSEREAESLVRLTFRAPMSQDNLATLQQVFAAEGSGGLAFSAEVGARLLTLKVTPEAYQVLAQAVGFVAFPR